MVFVSEFGFSRLRSVRRARPESAATLSSKIAVSDEDQSVSDVVVKHTSRVVPVYGSDAHDQSVETVSAAPVSDSKVMLDSDPAEFSGVSRVQCTQAWQRMVDRLNTVRGTIMVAVDHDQKVTDLILDSLTLHSQVKRCSKELQEISQKPDRQLAGVTLAYVAQIVQRGDAAAAQLEAYVTSVVSDAVALRQLIDKLRSATDGTQQRMATVVFTRELAERRAYLRAVTRQVQLRLQQLPELSVQERSVREQLQSFTVLDSFPNLPNNPEDRDNLLETLNILEPILASLQSSITAIMERPVPEVDSAADTEIQLDDNWWENNASADVRSSTTSSAFSDEPEESVATSANAPANTKETFLPKELDEGEAWSRSVSRVIDSVNVSPRTMSNKQPLSNLSQGLGQYRLQRGDTLVDILLGETDAGILPAMVEIPPSYITTIAELLRTYLNQFRTVRQYLGTRESIDVWAMRGSGHPKISLDHLNDTVMFIAVQNDLIEVSDSAWTHLSELFSALESTSFEVDKTLAKSASDLTPQSVRQRAQGLDRGVHYARTSPEVKEHVISPESVGAFSLLPTSVQHIWQDVIDEVYQGQLEAYETDFVAWLEAVFTMPRNQTHLVSSVFRKPTGKIDARHEFLTLSFSEWSDLLSTTTTRYAWLQQHVVPVSVWRDWSKQVLAWQKNLQKYPREMVQQLPLFAVAELVFIDRSLKSRL